MVVVAILGFSNGDPNLLLYPYDDDSNQCGYKNLTDYPYIYFYKTLSNAQSLNITASMSGVCVASCPTVNEKLNCTPTTHNPDCSVSIVDFYVSTPCK